MARESDVPTPGQLASMWWSQYNSWQTTRLRVRDCRDWLNNRWDPVVPKDFAQVAGNLAVKFPYSVSVALHAVQMLSGKRPRLRRDPMGKSVTARTGASDLEIWANAAVTAIEEQHGQFWRPLMDMLFNQGSATVLCFPSAAGWENMPSFVDEDGGVYPQFKKQTMKQSASEYEDFLLDWRARQTPISIRVIGIDQSLPILGPGHRLDGLLVRSQYAQEELEARGYRWRFGDTGHIGPGYDPDYMSQSRGSYPKFTLYELWRPGSVVYYIGQGVTAPATDGSNITLAHRVNAGGETNLAAVDLAADFGISRMCGTFIWGCNFASETDADRRGVPFLWPYLSMFQGLNNLATAKLAHVWSTAFGGWFIPANADVSPDLVLENGRPREIEIQPMKAQYVAGVPVPATHPGTGKDVDELMGQMLAAIEHEAPSSVAGGGPGATSGHDRALIRSQLQDAYDDCLNGGLQAMSFVGSMATEIADRIVEHYDVTVPVYCSVQPKGMRQSVRKAQELTRDMTAGVYDFWCEYPPEDGENPVFAQQLMEWSLQGRIPLRMALEKGMGDENPDETMIEIQTEHLLFNTPQGQQYLFQLVAKKLDDEKMAQLFQAVQTGQAMPDGTPTAALPGGGQPQPGPGGAPPQLGVLSGTATQNPAASALGGIVAGGIGGGPQAADQIAAAQAGAITGRRAT